MRIDHAAVYVTDLDKARDFFIRYFDARCGSLYHNPKTGFSSYFLSFSDGARLEIMTLDSLKPGSRAEVAAGYAHIAFSVGSREGVDELTARLRDDGYAVISGPRVTGDGYYESAVLDGEGNRIEITV